MWFSTMTILQKRKQNFLWILNELIPYKIIFGMKAYIKTKREKNSLHNYSFIREMSWLEKEKIGAFVYATIKNKATSFFPKLQKNGLKTDLNYS